MACEQYHEAILESVGAGAPPAEVQAHLNACADCRALAQRTRRALELMDELPPATVAPGFAARVLARAHAERRGQRSMWIAAAAAALLVVTLGWWAWSFTGPSGTPTDVARRTPDTEPPTATPESADAPPAELLENLELVENLELLQQLEALEALDAVEARERFTGLD